MGKLTIGVISCKILRTGEFLGQINPSVRLRIDDKYVFSTKVKRCERSPCFLESFVVGNTHRLAKIEVSVLHRSVHGEEIVVGKCTVCIKRLVRGSEKVRTHLLVNEVDPESSPLEPAMFDAASDDEDLSSIESCDEQDAPSFSQTPPVDATVDSPLRPLSYSLLGSRGVAPSPASLIDSAQTPLCPRERRGDSFRPPCADKNEATRKKRIVVAGSITLSLFSDEMGEYDCALNTQVEEAYVKRIQGYLMLRKRSLLPFVDLLIADVREPQETPSRKLGASAKKVTSTVASPVTSFVSNGSFVNGAHATTVPDTFASVLAKLVAKYGPETCPQNFRVSITGLEDLVLPRGIASEVKALNTPIFPYVVLRSSDQQFETDHVPVVQSAPSGSHNTGLNNNKLSTGKTEDKKTQKKKPKRVEANSVGGATKGGEFHSHLNSNVVTFDVRDPKSFVVEVIVMSRYTTQGDVEIGRGLITLHCFTKKKPTKRSFVMLHYGGGGELDISAQSDQADEVISIGGVIHLEATAIDFGLLPWEHYDVTRDRIAQLSRFLTRYDLAMLPQTDCLVARHLYDWDAFMHSLVCKHGREPGTCALVVTIGSVSSVWFSPSHPADDDNTDVFVEVRMGDLSFRTETTTLLAHRLTPFDQSFEIDVARETDVIEIELIAVRVDDKQKRIERVVGRVDVTALKIERNNAHWRQYTLVGDAGSTRAYCSGKIAVGLFSPTIGVDFAVDHESECIYTSRLLRYCECYLREKLHRVDVAVATTADMEGLLGQMVCDKGPEPQYYTACVTIEGIQRIGEPYAATGITVAIEAAMETHLTKGARPAMDPMLHETWCVDLMEPFLSPSTRTPETAQSSSPAATQGRGRRAEMMRLPATGKLQLPLREHTEIRLAVIASDCVSAPGGLIASAVFPVKSLSEHKEHREVISLTYYNSEDILNCNGVAVVRFYWMQMPQEHRIFAPSPRTILPTGMSLQSKRKALQLSPLKLTKEQRGDSFECEVHTPTRTLNHSLPRDSLSPTRVPVSPATVAGDATCRSVEASPPTATFTARLRRHLVTLTLHGCKGLPQVPEVMDRNSPAFGTLHVVVSVRYSNEPFEDCPSYRTEPLPYQSEVAFPASSSTFVVPVSFEEDTDRNGSDGKPIETMSTLENILEICGTSVWVAVVRQFTTRTHSSLTNHTEVLGECVLSTKHLPFGGVQRRKTVSLVQHANRRDAILQGTLDLSMGIGYNEDYDDEPEQSIVSSGVKKDLSTKLLPLTSVITEETERRMRQRVTALLLSSAPQELHKIELFLGEFAGNESQLFAMFVSKFNGVKGVVRTPQAQADLANDKSPRRGADKSTVGTFTVLVKEVRSLLKEGKPMETLACFVKVKTLREKYRTATKTGVSSVPFDETFTFQVTGMAPEPAAAQSKLEEKDEDVLKRMIDSDPNILHVVVKSSGPFSSVYGEVAISLRNLQTGVAKERTFPLVCKVGTSAAEPCGLVTLSVRSDCLGHNAPVDEAQEHLYNMRLRNFFQRYRREELHRIDLYVGLVTSATIAPTGWNSAGWDGMDILMDHLVTVFGPEPGHYHLEVRVVGLQGTVKTDTTGGHSRPYVVLRLGVSQFQTKAIHAMTHEISIGETFTFDVGIPQEDELTVYVMDEPASQSIRSTKYVDVTDSSPEVVATNCSKGCTESGRVVVSLKRIRRGIVTTRKFPLVYRAGSKDAAEYGSITLSFMTRDFGTSGPLLRENDFAAYQQRVIKLLSRYSPTTMHQYDIVMGNYLNREDDLMRHLVSKYGAEPGSYPLFVRVIAFRAVALAQSVYLDEAQTQILESIHERELILKVFNNGVEILKTRPICVDAVTDAQLSSAQNNTVTTEVCNLEDSLLTFKLFVKGVFGKVEVSAVDMGVRDLVRNFPNIRWLRLFHAPSGGLLLGQLGIEVKSSAFGLLTAKRDEEVCEEVAADIVAAMRKYQPSDLRQLDVVMERCERLEDAHSKLRTKYRPDATATLFVTVHHVELFSSDTDSEGAGHSLNSKSWRQPPHLKKCPRRVTVVGSLGGDTASCDGVPMLHHHQGIFDVYTRLSTNEESGSPTRNPGPSIPVSPLGSAVGKFGILRLDFSNPRGDGANDPVNAPVLKLRVVERKRNTAERMLGCTEGSVRAMLSHFAGGCQALYDSDVKIPLPLVSVQQTLNSVEAHITGRIVVTLSKPNFESVPKSLLYHPSVAALFKRDSIMRFYKSILIFFLQKDPGSLASIHHVFFDREIGGGQWQRTLPKILDLLRDQWGPLPPALASLANDSNGPRTTIIS